MNFFAKLLRIIGHSTPAWFPHGTSIGNRLLKPAYKFFLGISRWQIVVVWPPIVMKLNPCECVGGNLYFSPHLYDVCEREWIERYLPQDGTFLDVGANLGVYSLWAARFLNSKGKILAVEADKDTYQILQENLAMNDYQCSVIAENIGVSDRFEELQFYKNTQANSGANSFHTTKDSIPSGILKLVPLMSILENHDFNNVDFLKIDIEGFELKVLSGFFLDCAEKLNNNLKPKYIMIEIDEGPRSSDAEYKTAVRNMFSSAGYRVAFEGKNTLYRLGNNEQL
jgi:FkbM family methyltransferase